MPSFAIGNSMPHSRKSAPDALLHGTALPVSQMPEKSGLPSRERGAGAVRFGLPLARRGMPSVRFFRNCADASGCAMTHARLAAARTRLALIRDNHSPFDHELRIQKIPVPIERVA